MDTKDISMRVPEPGERVEYKDFGGHMGGKTTSDAEWAELEAQSAVRMARRSLPKRVYRAPSISDTKALTPVEQAEAQRMGERIAYNVSVERRAREIVAEHHARDSARTIGGLNDLANRGIISRDGAESLKKQIIANRRMR